MTRVAKKRKDPQLLLRVFWQREKDSTPRRKRRELRPD